MTETIEQRNRNALPEDSVVERGEGEFLVLDRFFHDHYKENGELVLVYNVQKVLSPKEFYGMIHMRATGPCTAEDISDHLVKAFDYSVAEQLELASGLFAYRAPDGRIMHQHST